MNEHTKEPWGFQRDCDGLKDIGIDDAGDTMFGEVEFDNISSHTQRDSTGQWTEVCRWCHREDCQSPSDEDARRIVACVNACAGMPTNRLEKIAANPNMTLVASKLLLKMEAHDERPD